MSGRKTYHHGDLRRALLVEGRVLLGETGPEAFSLSALARRVGVSVAAPYRHFADRDAILDALGDEGYLLFDAALKDAIARSCDEGDALRRIGLAYLDFADRERAYFSVMFRDREGRPHEVGPASFATFAGAIAAAQASGRLDPAADPRSLGRAIWGGLHGVAVLERSGGFAKLGLDVPPERLVDDVLGAHLRMGSGSGGEARA